MEPSSQASMLASTLQQPIIELRHVTKRYESVAGAFTALQQIDMQVNAGEFVGVIGKSGSGKSTLINMMTGIDRPTSGEVIIADTPVHTLSEGQTAVWRGRNLGIVFQFFQLLPTLSLLQNVMLPMDFRGIYARRERPQRAMTLLERVGMAEHAHKLPSAVSGGQQQRVAIARALANDPPILIADEPTGNLDSKTAESVFALFEELVREGKTIVMVTHDNDLARRVGRVIIVVDGQIVNQYVASALSTLDLDQLSVAASRLTPITFPPGATVIRQGAVADRFYIITQGHADVLLEHPGGQEIPVDRLGPGQYFGEIAVLRGGLRTATVRAADSAPLDVMALDGASFRDLVGDSANTREEVDRTLRDRLTQLSALSQQR
jgi:ABC-type lipoprotein export system ATPase subunit